MCKKDDGVSTQHHHHTTTTEQQQHTAEAGSTSATTAGGEQLRVQQQQQQHQSLQLQQQVQQQVQQLGKQAESVEDGGGGDGGAGGGGGCEGVSVEEKQEVMANMQVKMDGKASCTTTVSENDSEVTTKTTTSRFTRTTKVKTIKVVKKKTTSSLVGSIISDLNNRTEAPLMVVGDSSSSSPSPCPSPASPKKIGGFKRNSETPPPKKIPGLPIKITKTVKSQDSTEASKTITKLDSDKPKDSGKIDNGESKTVNKVHTEKPEDSIKVDSHNAENCEMVDSGEKQDSAKLESIKIKETAKGDSDEKQDMAKADSVKVKFSRKASSEKQELLKVDSLKSKTSVKVETGKSKSSSSTVDASLTNDIEAKENGVTKDSSVDSKDTVEANDLQSGKDETERKTVSKGKLSITAKDSERKITIARKESVEKNESAVAKTTMKTKVALKPKDPTKVRFSDAKKLKNSVDTNESVKPKKSVETNDSAKAKEKVETEDAVRPKESVKKSDTVESETNDSAKAKEKVETEDAVRPKESIKKSDTVESKDSVKENKSSVSNSSAETNDSVVCKESAKTIDSVKPKDLVIANDCVKPKESVKVKESVSKSKDSLKADVSVRSKDFIAINDSVKCNKEAVTVNHIDNHDDSAMKNHSLQLKDQVATSSSENMNLSGPEADSAATAEVSGVTDTGDSTKSLQSVKSKSPKPIKSTEIVLSLAENGTESTSSAEPSKDTDSTDTGIYECPKILDSSKADDSLATSDKLDADSVTENSECNDKIETNDISSSCEAESSSATTSNEKAKFSDADSLLDSELDNVSIFVIVRDMSGLTATVNKVTIVTPATSTCGELMQEVGRRFKYEPDSFSLILQCSNGDQVEVEKMEAERTLADARFQVEGTPRNNLILCDLGGHPPRRTDEDDLSLGASASPTANATERKWFDRSNNYETSTTEYSYASALIKHDTGYVGLVNQAMTCYLNSLLQTLYMTPEFRNALYQWEFKGTEDEATKNIPCQIQRLFLLLQTANKSAVETTNLTRSFGWDSSEAWQQHDIQELCRVMFDALEQCFKNTHQSDLINSLYEGKMKDYVKCLECQTEGAREDTYLDIPLPIRPFGSSSAYKSVEEALRAFVEPELLMGNNQYKCSKCDSLCDAHKGLKFTRFPYLLTIHLMRFDFDYQTLHRIKLNDKVTFPNILDLNSFVDVTKEDNTASTTAVTPDKSSTDKIDDASTTDSGSALDVEDSSVENTSNSQPESDNQDEDEGIDVSSMYNEKNKTWLNNGPYVYELFSIMVHSGSASGGHYYAYIKDFASGEWFCFNDQSVTKITYDDIRKTYGGSSSSRGGYYSSWTSSANAYMLMYRQIDKERNVYAFTKDHLPQHIKDLVIKMNQEEAAEREQREMERSTCRIKLFCQPPGHSQMTEKKLRVHKDATLTETTKLAYKELGLENVVPVERCRLVKYEEFHDSLECSFEGQEEEAISEILGGVRSSYKFDLLMEIRDEDKTFEVYKPGGTTVKAHVVNLTTEEVEGPYNLRGSLNMSVRELKEMIGRSLNLNPDTMRVVLERYYNDLRPLTSDSNTLKMEGFYRSNKVYVEASGTEATDFFTGSCMYTILDRYENTITLFCPLPDTSTEALEELQIPPFKEEEIESLAGDSSSSTTSCNGLASTSPSATSPATSAASPASCSSKDSGISSKAPADSSSEAGSSRTSSLVSPASGGPSVASTSSSPSSLPGSSGSSPGMSVQGGSIVPLVGGATATTPTASPTTGLGNGSDGEDEGIADADSGAGSSNVNSDQSASEDSSLTSDSDRTLVGDPPEDKLSDASNSPDYRNVSSPEDNGRETKDTDGAWGQDEKEVEVKRYFRAEYFTEEETKHKMLRVYVDKRITIGQLKTEMQRWVGVSHEHFKLFKIYANSQEFECTRMTETLASYGDNTKLSIRLGRALLPGEQRGKVFLLEPDNTEDPARFLIDWVVCHGETIANAKKAIVKEVNTRCNMTLAVETVRLRKKSWKNPQTIYLDKQKFEDDIPLYSSWEMFLQVIDGPETRTSNTDELAIFVKRWHPSTYTTDPLKEILIPGPTSDALKAKLSEISGIEAENIEFTKGRGTFPCDMSVMDINNDLDWTPRNGPLDQRPLYIMDDGAMIYYKDKTEVLKELTDEERRELTNSENRRLNRDMQYPCPTSTTSYSTLRSKEKGLKIYLNHDE